MKCPVCNGNKTYEVFTQCPLSEEGDGSINEYDCDNCDENGNTPIGSLWAGNVGRQKKTITYAVFDGQKWFVNIGTDYYFVKFKPLYRMEKVE